MADRPASYDLPHANFPLSQQKHVYLNKNMLVNHVTVNLATANLTTR